MPLSGATSTLSRPAVPQSHRTAKKTFSKPGFAVRSSLNPASGLRPESSGSASEMTARISLTEGRRPTSATLSIWHLAVSRPWWAVLDLNQ